MMPEERYLWPDALLPPALSEPEPPIPAQTVADLERALAAVAVQPSAGQCWRGTVYLLHFAEPYQHARHYLGWTGLRLAERLTRHSTDRGARLLQVIAQAGIAWQLVRVWDNASREVERKLKNWHNTPQLCPLCDPAAWQHGEP